MISRTCEQINRASKVRPPSVTGGLRQIIGEHRLASSPDVRAAWNRLCKRDGKAHADAHFLPLHPRAGGLNPGLNIARPDSAQLAKLSEALSALPSQQQLKPVMLVSGGRFEMVPTPDSLQQDHAIITLSRRIADLGEVSIQRVPFTMWPRDYFTDFFGVHFWKEDRKSFDDTTDTAASGGAVIPGEQNSFVMMSEALDDVDKCKLRNAYQLRARVYELPGGYVLRRDGGYHQAGHLDYSIGLSENLGVLLVDEVYWGNHESALVHLLEGERRVGNELKLVLVGHNEKKYYPTNLIEFPNGRVLLNYSPETYEKIKQAVGSEVATALEMIGSPELLDNLIKGNGDEYDVGGGIRCLTNRYFPIVDYLLCVGLPEETIRSFLAWFNSLRPNEYLSLLTSGWSPQHEESLREYSERLIMPSKR